MYVVPAEIATGEDRSTCCQPIAVSAVNVAVAQPRAAPAVHSVPT